MRVGVSCNGVASVGAKDGFFVICGILSLQMYESLGSRRQNGHEVACF